MSEIKADYFLDMRKVSCPLNYVKTKLKLEGLEQGSKLEVLLSDGEPIVNVPRSVKEDGHKVLDIKQVDGYYKVIFEKG